MIYTDNVSQHDAAIMFRMREKGHSFDLIAEKFYGRKSRRNLPARVLLGIQVKRNSRCPECGARVVVASPFDMCMLCYLRWRIANSPKIERLPDDPDVECSPDFLTLRGHDDPCGPAPEIQAILQRESQQGPIQTSLRRRAAEKGISRTQCLRPFARG